MKVKKTIQIEVEYNIDDSISDIDFTRVENFDNFITLKISTTLKYLKFRQLLLKFRQI